MSDDRAELFLRDILDGPAALLRLLDAYAASGGPLAALPADALAGRRVLFTGMGSSRFAALTVAAGLGARGVHAVVEHASTGQPVPPADDLVVFAVSSSGRTPEVVEAVRRHRGRSAVVGVTNGPDSPVAQESPVCLPLLAGDERAGVACRTYAATLAALALATDGDGGREERIAELRAAASAGRALRAAREAWLAPAADLLDGAAEIHVVGDGSRMGSLEQAALLLREAPRLAAIPADAGDWLHTTIYTMLPGGRAILFGGTPYDDEIVRTVRGRGGEVLAVGPPVAGAAVGVDVPSPAGPVERAVLEIAVAELVAAELWRRTPA